MDEQHSHPDPSGQESKEGREGDFDLVIEQLLQASFPYLGISALRMVPIAAMQAMKDVPQQFLRQLGHDKEVFDILPQRVKHQVQASTPGGGGWQ